MKIAEISETFKKKLKLQPESPHDIDIDLNFVAIVGSHAPNQRSRHVKVGEFPSLPSHRIGVQDEA